MKTAHSLDQQRKKLLANGLVITDHSRTNGALLDCNYYRLSGYFRQFQISPADKLNQFLEGTTFDDIRAVHDLDNALSRILVNQLALIERSVRARFAYFLAQSHGAQAFYLEDDFYLELSDSQRIDTAQLQSQLERSRAKTVWRYRNGDDFSRVPVWVALETLSFGSVSKMLLYAKDDSPAKDVARSYSLPWEGFQSAIHSLSVLRNRCAHHGQVWHRRLDIQMPVQKKLRRFEPKFDVQGPYAAIIVMKRFSQAGLGESDFVREISEFQHDHPRFFSGILHPLPK